MAQNCLAILECWLACLELHTTQINGITSAANNFFDADSSHIAFTMFGHDYTWTTVICGLLITILLHWLSLVGWKRVSMVLRSLFRLWQFCMYCACWSSLSPTLQSFRVQIVEIVEGAFGTVQLPAVHWCDDGSDAKGCCKRYFLQRSWSWFCTDCSSCCTDKRTSSSRLGYYDRHSLLDTIVICTMTGLSIVISGEWSNPDLQGVQITTAAFQSGLPIGGKFPAFIS